MDLWKKKKLFMKVKKIIVGEGEFQTDFNKSMKENTLPLLFSALALSDPKEQYFQVVLGLPIQQYKSNKKELVAFIEDNKSKEVIIGGNKRDIVITDIEVAPEGASAYYNLTLDEKNRLGNKQLIIVDIGGRTTDVCLFKDKRIKDYKTIPVGMLNIYADIVSIVNEKYTESFKLEEGEDILKDGLFLGGEQVENKKI